MKAFDDVSKYLQKRIDEAKGDGFPKIIETLKQIGRDCIDEAVMTKGTGNITYNQMEAYFSAVYYNGKFCKGTSYFPNKNKLGVNIKGTDKFRYTKGGSPREGSEKDPKRHKLGRSEALHAATRYKPTSNGYVLFFGNAMWYSSIHEKQDRHIIIQVLSLASELAKGRLKINATVEFENYGYRK